MGQLGVASRVGKVTTPEAVFRSFFSTRTFESLSVHHSSLCGVTAEKELYCWGNNTGNKLGVNNAHNLYITSPRLVQAPDQIQGTFSGVSTGEVSTCAVFASSGASHAVCWGEKKAWGVSEKATDTIRLSTRIAVENPIGKHRCTWSLETNNVPTKVEGKVKFDTGVPELGVGASRVIQVDSDKPANEVDIDESLLAEEPGRKRITLSVTAELAALIDYQCSGSISVINESSQFPPIEAFGATRSFQPFSAKPLELKH